MILHKYQSEGIDACAEATTRYKYILRQLPTGGGKTVEFSGISHRYTYANPGKSVMVLVHRIELLNQTRNTMWEAFGLSAQPIKAGMKFVPTAPVYVGMVESTLSRLPHVKNVGLAIIDECHEGIFDTIRERLIKEYPGIIVIGFTATPLATNRKNPLNKFYQTIICGPQIQQLIELGREYEKQGLVQNITYAPKDVVDRLALTVKGNDFDAVFMGSEYKKPRYVNNTVDAYKRKADGKKTIIFNVNVLHSQTVCEAFNKAGYSAKHIDGKTPKNQRAETLRWFKLTDGAILCNCDIARTGFDEPSIECVIVNLSTMSMVKWLQMCGRGGRKYNMYVDSTGELIYRKNHFIVIDMGGNAHTHDDWNADRDWKEVFDNPPKPSKGGGVSPTKTCPNPECEAVIHAAARECPVCHHKFDEKEIALEVDMKEFIVMTKGINVDNIIKFAEANRYKEYYPLFQIGRVMAQNAAKTIKEMTDERAIFIFQEYEKRGKEWHEKHNIQREKESELKKLVLPKRVFSAGMKERCKEILFTELKTHFPLWNVTQTPPPQSVPQPTLSALKSVPSIENIQNLKNLHYEL